MQYKHNNIESFKIRQENKIYNDNFLSELKFNLNPSDYEGFLDSNT